MTGEAQPLPGPVLGLVPARGGSKRIPGKNLKELAGRPLLAHTAAPALACGMLDRVLLSTDSEEIRQLGIGVGLEAPFLRPAELAADHSGDREVLRHALQWLEVEQDWKPWALVLLRPTSPFRTAQMIEQALRRLAETGADSLRSMTRVEGVHHPNWMYRQDGQGRCRNLLPEGPETYYQSQLLPPVFRLNGVVDVLLGDVIMGEGPLYGEDMRMLEIPGHAALDLDTPEDWRLAEFLLAGAGEAENASQPRDEE